MQAFDGRDIMRGQGFSVSPFPPLEVRALSIAAARGGGMDAAWVVGGPGVLLSESRMDGTDRSS